ncbi:hypothetical protein Tco_0856708 [Tanacetum coccineum]|uniref:Uncharacterized protein n=1 Tax=Tanacetum coccineum TaxID=301880 RepID=A0ABQ5B428_9ASTR
MKREGREEEGEGGVGEGEEEGRGGVEEEEGRREREVRKYRAGRGRREYGGREDGRVDDGGERWSVTWDECKGRCWRGEDGEAGHGSGRGAGWDGGRCCGEACNREDVTMAGEGDNERGEETLGVASGVGQSDGMITGREGERGEGGGGRDRRIRVRRRRDTVVVVA